MLSHATSRARLYQALSLVFLLLICTSASGQSSDASRPNLRVVAANLNGTSQKIENFAIRIFQGLKPDVVAIQEFNYLNNTPAEIRSFINTTFGTNFVYYRESSSYQIPNGIISRYPILASGSWPDSEVANRGFAWARIDLPGTNDLYVVSVHLLTSSSSDRAREASNLKALIQSNFPPDAWIIVAGDMNTGSRTESAITTFKSFLSDNPIPVDAKGNPNTNLNREKPYDYVLVSFSMTNRMTNVVFASQSFPNGLVFDSRVYTPLSDVVPVQTADSGNGQHMAVVKDFHLGTVTNGEPAQLPPTIIAHPQSLIIPEGGTAGFSVTAAGSPQLAYQWRHGETNLPGATQAAYTIGQVRQENIGAYTVVVTNVYGSVTSSPAMLSLAPTNTTGEFSGILAGWDVNGLTQFGPSPLAPTINAAHLVVTGLTRGAGLGTNTSAASGAWGAVGFGASTVSEAIAEGDYITFSVTPMSGYRASFEALSTFNYRRSSTGPVAGLIQVKVGDSAYTDLANVSYTSTTGAALPGLSLLGQSALQNVGPGTNITFRIVNYNGSSGGTWYVYDLTKTSELELAVAGTVTPIVVSPPQPILLTNAALVAPEQFAFTLAGTSGTPYVIETATNSVNGPWKPISTNFAGQPLTNDVSSGQQWFRARTAP